MLLPTLNILKIGGNVVESSLWLNPVLDAFAALPGSRLLVHGGGKRASDMSMALDIEPRMVEGRRITDAATLEVVTMVYAGLLNKNLVAQLQRRQINALGLSGADANVIRASKRSKGEIDYGFAGDIQAVDAHFLSSCLQQDICPVCCPITHDGAGQLLNTNADTIASAVAIALAPHYRVRLMYCFEKPGVLADPTDEQSVIGHLSPDLYREYRHQGIITEGMIPKLDNAFAAIQQGVEAVLIGNPESLFQGGATTITA